MFIPMIVLDPHQLQPRSVRIVGGKCGLTHLVRWISVRPAKRCKPMLVTSARVILRALVTISGSSLGQIQYILYKVNHRIFRIIRLIVRRNLGLTLLR